MIDAEITVHCENTRRDEYRAFFYDGATSQFYGGSGPTPLEALAWCMDEYIARALMGFPVSPARNGNATPGSRFKNQPTPITFEAPAPVLLVDSTKPRSRKRGKKAA